MGSGKLIKRAIKKHGIENFEKTILYKLNSEEDMNTKEAQLVTEEYCKSNHTYNLCPGGKGGWGYINQNGLSGHSLGALAANSTDLKRKASSNRLKKTWEEGKMPLTKNNGWTGRQHREETKEKLRKSKNQGSKNSQFGTIWINNGIKAKKWKGDIPNGWFKGRKL